MYIMTIFYDKFLENFLRYISSKSKPIASFQSNFNVTFGLMSEDDLLFKRLPESQVRQNFTDLIYTSVWTSLSPFLQG